MDNKRVSVTIPCRNEVKTIRNCVESVLNSNYPDIEVIVADGMSDDGTREVLSELSKEYSNVKMVDNPEKLTPYAFNYGIKNSTGFYIQIVGSRNILDPEYIPTLVKVLDENSEIACVGGDYQHDFQNKTSKYISWAMESKFGVGADNYRTMKESCYVDTVGVPMYRRSIFDELGFFDERLTRNQDDDFNFRITKAGYKIYYAAEAKCKYFVRGSFSKLFKQMSQYGYFKVFVNKKHKTITTVRQLVPMFFLSFIFVGIFLGLYWNPFFYIYASVLALYFLLGALSAKSFTTNPIEILKIQLAILYMHIGYGWGYLKGIFDFLILKRVPNSKMERQTT